jgi:hypothetical protein
MSVYVSSDSLKPSDHLVEQAYSYGYGGLGPPVLMDSAGDGQQESNLMGTNTATVFSHGGSIYKLLNRQQVPLATVIVRSTDGGATWTVPDAANAPAFQNCTGYYDAASATVICVYVTLGGQLRLITFDLTSQTWVPNASVGPAALVRPCPAIWLRPNGSYLILYQKQLTVTGTGLSAVTFDPTFSTWGTPFDVGENITLLLGWDAAQSSCDMGHTRMTMDSGGVVHVFFTTQSLQVAPVIWGNRVFYQQINLDNTLGAFFDFPGQVAPFPAFPYDTQQLTVYSGVPFGSPIIVGANIILPVAVRNDSHIDRFPHQLPSIYIGTPVAAPVWSMAPVTDPQFTVDPGTIADDFIWIQQAPSISYDGSILYIVYSAQDEDGQNLARLRMCQTASPSTPLLGWSASTIFDLQVSASPPGFQFPTQFLSGAGAFSAIVAPPVVLPFLRIDPRALPVVALPSSHHCT